MAPGIVPFATSAFIHCVMRSSRSADKPTSAGFAAGRFCAVAAAASANTRTNDRAKALTARILVPPLGDGAPEGTPDFIDDAEQGEQMSPRERNCDEPQAVSV